MARTPPPEPPDEETVVRQERWEAGQPVRDRRVVEEEVAEPYEPPPPPDRHIWPWLLLLLVLVLGGLALLWYFSQDDEEAKPVPAVVRLTEADAVELLNEEGFDARVRRLPNDQAPRGIVFAQDPGAGRELEEDRVVTISVSTGPAGVDVPNVVGLPRAQAEERLREANLGTRAVSVFSEEPRGVVVAQNPRAGERAPRNSRVRINVSQGTGRVEVPDVVGRTAAQARTALSQAGLRFREVRVPSAEPEGRVVAQSPTAGSEVARGSIVRVNVSDGTGAQEPAERQVPNVEGLTEEEAIAELEDAGFTVRIRREEVTDPAEDGVVLSQQPAGGETAREGDEVAITVGQLAG